MTEENQNPFMQEEDKLSTGLTILSFCIPIAGAILYFTNKDQMPNKAKTACYAALGGAALAIVLNVIMVLVGGIGG